MLKKITSVCAKAPWAFLLQAFSPAVFGILHLFTMEECTHLVLYSLLIHHCTGMFPKYQQPCQELILHLHSLNFIPNSKHNVVCEMGLGLSPHPHKLHDLFFSFMSIIFFPITYFAFCILSLKAPFQVLL